MTRIADGIKTGHASWTHDYAIGVHSCKACGTETPGPSQDVLDELAAGHSAISTVWPFEQWDPPGWMDIKEYGHICPACSRAVMALLSARGRGEELKSNHRADLVILEQNVSRALELAAGGLLADFPPPPRPYKEANPDGYPHRYMHPTKSFVYQRLDDYKQGALRERIREIENVLLGKPENAQ